METASAQTTGLAVTIDRVSSDFATALSSPDLLAQFGSQGASPAAGAAALTNYQDNRATSDHAIKAIAAIGKNRFISAQPSRRSPFSVLEQPNKALRRQVGGARPSNCKPLPSLLHYP
jgi:hypothetical protein